jgi:pimeloyl-ACP methyl ester carboxylesterase
MTRVVARDFWVNTDRGRLYAKRWCPASAETNADDPIVLFHDSLGCVELWRDFPERLALATESSVVAYDRLGFGRSDPHPGMLDRGFVRDEAAVGFRSLRETLGIEKIIAFGHSVGGGMAVACAATYPTDCRALITESAQAFVEDRTIQGIRDAERAFQQAVQRDRLKKYHGDKAGWVLAAWIDTWLSSGFADWNLDEDLRRVRCPALVLHGDDDEFGSTLHPKRIAELTSTYSTLRILEGCGHVPHRERSEEIVDLVACWLDR